MSHDVLIAVLLLVSISPLLILMAWSKSQIVQTKEQHERHLETKMKRIELMMPDCVCLWINLLQVIQNKETEAEINKCAEDVERYIRFMVS